MISDLYIARVSAEPLPENITEEYILHTNATILCVMRKDFRSVKNAFLARPLNDEAFCDFVRGMSEFDPGLTYVTVARGRSSKLDIFPVR